MTSAIERQTIPLAIEEAVSAARLFTAEFACAVLEMLPPSARSSAERDIDAAEDDSLSPVLQIIERHGKQCWAGLYGAFVLEADDAKRAAVQAAAREVIASLGDASNVILFPTPVDA